MVNTNYKKYYCNRIKYNMYISNINYIHQTIRCVGYTNSSNINYKSYIERLGYFKLESLELRRLKIDLTKIF